MRGFLPKVLFGAGVFVSLALSDAHATPVPGTHEITVNTKTVDGCSSPKVALSSITGAPGQQWIWNGATFTNIQSGALLADNGSGAPTENSVGGYVQSSRSGLGVEYRRRSDGELPRHP